MFFRRAITSFAFTTVLATQSFAEISSGATGGADNTIGEKIANVLNNAWNPLLLLIVVMAGVIGIYMMARGLMKLSEAASDRGGGRGFAPGLAWILVGAALIALPDVAGVGMTTIFGSAKGGGTLGSAGLDYNDGGLSGDFTAALIGGVGTPGNVDNCIVASEPAVCMAKNISVNAVPMATSALFALVFLLGLLGFAHTLLEMAKNADGRDQSKSHITRLVIMAMVMNAPLAFNFMSVTFFGNDNSTIGMNGINGASSLLTYDSGSNIEIVQKYSRLIAYSFTILTFFGAWAYIRGIFMVKGVAEAGRNAGSYGMASVYIVAGILMANSKASTCVILKTVGGTGLATGFCS